jgi:hypothetical protein
MRAPARVCQRRSSMSSSVKKEVRVNQPQAPQSVQVNIALITHSPSEVIVDFARLLPGSPKARVYSRIVMTPMNAKSLHKALGDNLEGFEKQYGAIKLPEAEPGSDKPMGFAK